MVIDTSAIMAILLKEPEAHDFAKAIARAEPRLVSSVTVLEACILSRSRRGNEGRHALDDFLAVGEFDVIAFDEDQARMACTAFATYGKGRHPAALNFGDCAVYALAAIRGEPLLFKGEDFSRTDIVAVA